MMSIGASWELDPARALAPLMSCEQRALRVGCAPRPLHLCLRRCTAIPHGDTGGRGGAGANGARVALALACICNPSRMPLYFAVGNCCAHQLAVVAVVGHQRGPHGAPASAATNLRFPSPSHSSCPFHPSPWRHQTPTRPRRRGRRPSASSNRAMSPGPWRTSRRPRALLRRRAPWRWTT